MTEFEPGYTGDGFTHQADEDAAEQEACERAAEPEESTQPDYIGTATYSPEDNKIRIYPFHRLPADIYARVKAAGFAWAPKQELFVAPMWTPRREDLARELCGEIGDEDTSLVERAEAKAERLEDLSDRKQAEADRAHKAVSAIADNIPFGQPILVGHHSEKHARKDAARIQNGMRRAVECWKAAGYWQERAKGALRLAKYKERPDVRARRIKGLEAEYRKCDKGLVQGQRQLKMWDIEPLTWIYCKRMTNDYRIGGSYCFPLAEYPRPEGASTYEGAMGLWSALGDSPETGIITPEQARELGRRSARGQVHAAQRWIAHLENRLAYERAMLGESGGLVAEQHDITVGGRVLVRGEWVTVLRLNRKDGKLLSVTTSRRYVPVVGAEEIGGYEAPSEETAAKVAAAVKRPPLCNYPGERFATCTEAEWKAIDSDHKSQSHRIAETETTGAHCVRYAIGYRLHLPASAGRELEPGYCSFNRTHTYWPVYVTDAKRKDPPAKGASPNPELPANRPEPTGKLAFNQDVQFTRATSEDWDKFKAMEEQLRRGVQVVTAPQLFPTPPELAARMVEEAGIEPGHRVLEPSAGTGNLLKPLPTVRPDGQVVAVEISSSLLYRLEPYADEIVCGDFLEQNGNLGQFDRVVMNPPFQNGADIKHIQHALKFLKPGGRLVAICANGSRQREILKPMAENSGGWWEDLPAGTFAEQGTNVNTALLVIEN